MRSSIFDIKEGYFVITHPDNISAESLGYIDEYLSVLMRVLKRKADAQAAEPEEN